MKLTVTSTASLTLPAGKTDHIEFDDEIPGFGLRIREGGARTLVFQYKIGAKQRRMKLGRLGAVDFKNARKKAMIYSGRVADGEDPAGEKAETRAKAHKTFGALVVDFLDHKRETLRPRSYPDLERHLLVYAKTLHGLQIDRIKLADIANCIAAVEKNSGKVTRNRARTSLSTFFSWALSEGCVTSNPVIGTRRAAEKSRDRVLSPTELRLIWNSLPDDDYGAIMKLLALTGQRASEIAGLRWSEVQRDLIELPGERTKNGLPHTVPLSLVAKAIVDAQPRRTTDKGKPRDLIFGNGEGPFSGWSKAKERLSAAIKKAGKALPHWTPHDLRRSFATYAGGGLPAHQLAKLSQSEQKQAGGLGVQPHIIEAVLNHISGFKAGVAGNYNRSTYESDKRVALDLWADRLMAIVENRESNVTALRRA